MFEDKVYVLKGDDGVEEVSVVLLHVVRDDDQLPVLVLLDRQDNDLVWKSDRKKSLGKKIFAVVNIHAKQFFFLSEKVV